MSHEKHSSDRRLIAFCVRSVRYVRPSVDVITVYFSMLDNGLIDLLLFPIIPNSSQSISKLLTVPLGFVNMISILSGVGWQQPRTFNFLYSFQPIVWLILLLALAVSPSLASCIARRATNVVPHRSHYLFYWSLLTTQSNKLVSSKLTANYAILLTAWLFLATVFCHGFHQALLSQMIHEKPHVLIDSIEDMAKSAIEGRLQEFYSFNGELCEEFMEERTDFAGEALRQKMTIVDIQENNKQEWESELFPKLSTGEFALISDNAFLDFYFTTKLSEYPNLYRGREELVSMPYFMALSDSVSEPIRIHINIM